MRQTLFTHRKHLSCQEDLTHRRRREKRPAVTPRPSCAGWVEGLESRVMFAAAPPAVSVEAPFPVAHENGRQPAYFAVERTGDLSQPLLVNLAVGGDAAPGVDYAPALPAAVTIDAGQSFAPVAVTPTAQGVSGGIKYVTVSLADGPYTAGSNTTAAVAVALDDPVPQVAVEAPPAFAVADEHTGAPAYFVLTRTGDLAAPLFLNVSLDGDAVAGVDYAALPDSPLYFAPGAASISLPVTPIDQGLQAGFHALTLVIAPGPYQPGGSVSATVGVALDDPPPPAVSVFVPPSFAVAHENGSVPAYFVLTRSGDLGQPLLLNVDVGGDAAPGVDYAALPDTPLYFAPGVGMLSLPVAPIDQGLSSGSQTVTLTIAPGPYQPGGDLSATVAIALDDPPPPTVSVFAPPSFAVAHENGAVPGYFVLTRSGDVSAPLLVDVSVGGDAAPGTDYSPLPASPVYFGAGVGMLSLPVTPIDRGATTGSLSVTLTVNPGSGYAVGDGGPAGVAIARDDPPRPQVSITAPPQYQTAHESGQVPGYFLVSRTGDLSQPLLVNVDVGGDAVAGADYAPLPASPLYLAPGVASVPIAVTPIDRGATSGSQQVTLSLAGGNYDAGADTAATVTIVDDDPVAPPPPITSVTQYDITAGGTLHQTGQFNGMDFPIGPRKGELFITPPQPVTAINTNRQPNPADVGFFISDDFRQPEDNNVNGGVLGTLHYLTNSSLVSLLGASVDRGFIDKYEPGKDNANVTVDPASGSIHVEIDRSVIAASDGSPDFIVGNVGGGFNTGCGIFAGTLDITFSNGGRHVEGSFSFQSQAPGGVDLFPTFTGKFSGDVH